MSRAWRTVGLGLAAASAACAGPFADWASHAVKQGDGRNGWRDFPAQKRFLAYAQPGTYTMVFGLHQMDNGEVILAGSWNDGTSRTYKAERCIIAFSRDRGDHWTNFALVPEAYGRPMMLTDLGRGRLFFQTDPIHNALPQQFFTSDYGRTWPVSRLLQKAANHGMNRGDDEGKFSTEGNALVDRAMDGTAVRVGEIGWNLGPHIVRGWPWDPAIGILRWSTDGGRTWTGDTEPEAWRISQDYRGKPYPRGVCEGSLVRAANGWLVAALRTDLPTRYLDGPISDELEGTATSVSRDDGRTWSPLKPLFGSGRHHANLLRLANGDILMTVIVRADFELGGTRKVSDREGCEAVLSHDNGLTWDVPRKYIVDAFDYNDPELWFYAKCGHLASCLLDNGQILTAYSNYADQHIVLVRWRPGPPP